MRRLILPLFLVFFSCSFPRVVHCQSEKASAEISADLGSCSALITVADGDAKPVYGAHVTGRVQYGMMGVKKLDLEAFTGADGQLKIDRLPNSLKKPLVIHIDKDGKADQVEFKPEVHCHATFDVQLR